MKKSILTLALALIGVATIAQTKLIPGQNGKIPDNAKHVQVANQVKQSPALKTDTVKKDTVKADANLRFDIPKQTAIQIIAGLQGAYAGVTRAENISAKQSNDAQIVAGYLLDLIYQKWPDLAPKRPANQ